MNGKIELNHDQIINKVLIDIESDIIRISKKFSLDIRDDVCQDVRIKLWKLMERNYPNSENIEELLTFCKLYVYSVSVYCSKPILRKKYKEEKRNLPIDQSMDLYECFQKNTHGTNVDKIAFYIDFEKYKNILSEKEFRFFQYLVDTDNDFSNFDALSREWGYTGKGTSKYNLENIAKKIFSFHEKSEKMTKNNKKTVENT